MNGILKIAASFITDSTKKRAFFSMISEKIPELKDSQILKSARDGLIWLPGKLGAS